MSWEIFYAFKHARNSLNFLWGEISFYELDGHSGFHKLNDFKVLGSVAGIDAVSIAQKLRLFLSCFLLNAFNTVFPNYESGCLSYTPSFLGMEDVMFGFLYFASGILLSYVLKWDSFHKILDNLIISHLSLI